MRIIVSFWVLIMTISACQTNDDAKKEYYKFDLPAHFTDQLEPIIPIEKDKVELGRRLFNDPILSGNNKVSCASCHLQKLAFSDGEALSTNGVNGKPVLRNSPALFNLVWMDEVFWDGGASNLQRQIFGPLEAENEMHQPLNELIEEIKNNPIYIDLFNRNFDDGFNLYNLTLAIEAYEKTIVSYQSQYDYYIAGNDNAMSGLAKKGYIIYQAKCASCHVEPLFTDNDFHNNGLDSVITLRGENDIYLGRYRITLDPNDLQKYKTPSLRNLSFTAPYMHDGRFNTIDEVLDFYSNNVRKSKTLDSLLQKDNKIGIELSNEDKNALKAFLKTLDDPFLITNDTY